MSELGLKQFVEFEKQHLSPLPAGPYQIKYYNRAKVQKMGVKNYYSVPYRYIGNDVEIQHTIDTVEIYYKKERLATHAKSYRGGSYTTIKDHLSITHLYYQSWSREFFVKMATAIGLYYRNFRHPYTRCPNNLKAILLC